MVVWVIARNGSQDKPLSGIINTTNRSANRVYTCIMCDVLGIIVGFAVWWGFGGLWVHC